MNGGKGLKEKFLTQLTTPTLNCKQFNGGFSRSLKGDFCFLSTYLAHFGSNEMTISPTGTDPDSTVVTSAWGNPRQRDLPNPQTFCFNCTMRPTAQSRNLIISLRYATGILLRSNRLFLAATYVFIFRGTKTFLSRLSVLDMISLVSTLATDLLLTHIRWAVLNQVYCTTLSTHAI